MKSAIRRTRARRAAAAQSLNFRTRADRTAWLTSDLPTFARNGHPRYPAVLMTGRLLACMRPRSMRIGGPVSLGTPLTSVKPLSGERSTNDLLAALPEPEWQRWLPELESIDMPLGQVLYESGTTLSHVYFPTSSIVSLLYVMEDGASAEIAVVGNEGIVGVSLFMGGGSTPSRAVVQSAGRGLRLKAQMMKDEFNRNGPVLHLLLRYTQALITQMSQTAVCNRHHSLDQQLCRWLLLSLDRLQGDELVMTQELIANMLGVRRGGVTEAALRLQEAGLIRYARGHITVLDRAGLERRTCECYAVVKKEYDRLLPATRAT
jgi:CRP-like cAMP-binding protein